MGYLKEKYTTNYFMGQDENGNHLEYGVEGVEDFQLGEIRAFDKEILDYVDFNGARVLEFGFGRGESIKHVWEKNAKSYVGVDFSEAAYEIAENFLKKYQIEGPKIFNDDALNFVRNLKNNNTKTEESLFDIVLMLDVVEHIPRAELVEILEILREFLAVPAVIVVNTPDFYVDNDVIADGLNALALDSSDHLFETQGMHCNRFTLDSLRTFFADNHYLPVSRGHYFLYDPDHPILHDNERSYRMLWNHAKKKGAKLIGELPSENFETTYKAEKLPNLITFEQGNLKGLSLYTSDNYLEYYHNGNYDILLENFLDKFDLQGGTIFDLGAFIGVNSLLFSKRIGKDGLVCAFEPNPYNRDRFLSNISKNEPLDEQIMLFPYAIMDQTNNSHFWVHRNVDEGISSASFVEGSHTTVAAKELKKLGFTDIEVSAKTLDSFVAETNIRPDVIKIDIEGSEHLALLGSSKTISKYKPILIMELHSAYSAASVLKFLAANGYHSEIIGVEDDGRCFIGAQTNARSVKNLNVETVSAKNEILVAEISLLRAEVEKSILHKRQNKELIANISKLNEDIVTLQDSNDALTDQNDDLAQQLTSLKLHLTRYQMFPIIRLVRKVRRVIFNLLK